VAASTQTLGAFLKTRVIQIAAALVVAGVIQTVSGRWGIDSYLYGWPFPFYDSSTAGQLLAGPSAFSVVGLFLDVILISAVIFGALFWIQRLLAFKRGT